MSRESRQIKQIKASMDEAETYEQWLAYAQELDKLEGREAEIFAARDQRLEEARKRRRDAHRSRDRDPMHGQRESSFPFDHSNQTPRDRRGSQVEAGISAPCGPEQSAVMPEVHLTGPAGCGNSQHHHNNQNEQASALLQPMG